MCLPVTRLWKFISPASSQVKAGFTRDELSAIREEHGFTFRLFDACRNRDGSVYNTQMSANLIQQFLPGYPIHLRAQIAQLYAHGQLGDYLQQRYAELHTIQSDKALYDFCSALKQRYLKNAPMLDKVYFDSQLTIEKQTLGLNTAISRVQGGKLKAKKEIRISAFFKTAPLAFLNMIVVHELAHLKQRDHDKAFYQLCLHMEPNYMQYEFDCRVYLLWRALERMPQSVKSPA